MMTQARKITVSVIMPALNEEEDICAAIDSVLAAFSVYGINGEIIVVDDGSSDNTARIVGQKTAQDSRIRLISHKFPRGIGASFWDGVHSSGAEAVVMIPGDNENKPEEILRYLSSLDYVDMVIPYVGNTQDRTLPRRIFSRIYTGIINATFGLKLRYYNGTVLYKKEVLDCVKPYSLGFFYQTEILVKAIRKGWRFTEVGYTLRKKDVRNSRSLSWVSFVDIVRSYLFLCKN